MILYWNNKGGKENKSYESRPKKMENGHSPMPGSVLMPVVFGLGGFIAYKKNH